MRFFALSFAFLVASPALAGKSKVAVHPVVLIGRGVQKDAAGQMTKAVIEELRATNLSVQTAEETPKAPVAKATPKSASAAESELTEARRELERMHIPKATSLLEASLRGLAADVANVADHGRFVDAQLLLAEAHYRQGSEASGRRALEAVVRWAPETTLDTRRYPPVFVHAFEDVRSSVLAGPRGSVSVTSSPEGARVTFNGKAMGLTPLVIDDVVPGENHVVVRSDDDQRSGAIVQVEARRTQEARIVLGDVASVGDSGVRAGIAANRFDTAERLAGLSLARSASADVIVLLGMAQGDRLYSVGGFIGSTKTGRWAALPLLQVDADMLSASIESGKLAREIAAQVKAFKATVTDGTLPFVPGRTPLAPVVSRSATQAAHVSFVGVVAAPMVAAARAPDTRTPAAGDRRPATDVRQPIGDERRPTADVRQPIGDDRRPTADVRQPIGDDRRPTVDVRRPIGDERRPIGDERRPIGDERRPTTVVRQPIADERRAPESDDRTPIGQRAAPQPAPEDDRPLTRSIAAENLERDSAMAAHLAAIDGYSPRADTAGMGVQQSVEHGSVTRKWWFWAAVGVGAAVVGGTTYYFATRNHHDDTVSVQAAW